MQYSVVLMGTPIFFFVLVRAHYQSILGELLVIEIGIHCGSTRNSSGYICTGATD